MSEIVPISCPKCNNSHSFYRYGKDNLGFQKYQCRKCYHQFSPNRLKLTQVSKHPQCPMCGKASFLHHDHEYYSNYRCGDKKCNHSFFVAKPAAIAPASVSQLVGKSDFKRMRHPVHIILSALTMFFIGKSSFRDISFVLRTLFNIRISHVTVSDWCKKFAPMFHNMQISLMPTLNFNSDEWHADETVIKINGIKYYIWFIVDSETRFVLGFHLSPHRDSA